MSASGKRHLYDDNALVAACRAGEAWAWDALLNRYEALIFSIPRRMGISPADAEDIFQNVCILLLEHLDTIRDPGSLRGWIAQTARREAWRHERRRRSALGAPLPEGLDEEAHADLAEMPERELFALADRALVNEAMAALSARCQNLLALLYFADPPPEYREIAQRMGLPVGSIGPTRGRCLENLRKILEALDF